MLESQVCQKLQKNLANLSDQLTSHQTVTKSSEKELKIMVKELREENESLKEKHSKFYRVMEKIWQ